MTLKSTALDHVRELEKQGQLLKYQPSTPLDLGDEKRCLYLTPTVSRLLQGETVNLGWQADVLKLEYKPRMTLNASFRRFVMGKECGVIGPNEKSSEDPDWKLLDSPTRIVWEIRFRGKGDTWLRALGFFICKDVFVIFCLRDKHNLEKFRDYNSLIAAIEQNGEKMFSKGLMLSGIQYPESDLSKFYDQCLSNWGDAECLI